MDEKQAIQCLKRGEIDGLEFLVNSYQLKAVHTAYLITHNPALAEDVVQDCFIQVYRAIAGFDVNRPFEPWFLQIVVHASIKAAQKADKQVLLEPNLGEQWFENLLGRAESAEAEVDAIAFQHEVWQALSQLKPRQRAVIVQRYFLEMNEREIAAQITTAPGTVKWLLHSARNRLRTLLGGRMMK